MSGKSHRLMWIMTGVLTAMAVLVMYKTQRAIPFMMDDIWYSTMLYDETPIGSVYDIIKSQIWHYNNWGGRCITHGILQLTLLAGEQAADILNVVFTLLLGGIVCLVAEHRRLPAFFAAVSLPLGLNANWKMSMFWQAGAANYLYITLFILAFAYCYLRELPDKAVKAGTAMDGLENLPPKVLHGITLWIIPLGILAGWSNENMGPTMWILSLIVIWSARKEKRKVYPWMILGNLSCLAGSITCIIAPGNFVRSRQIEEETYGIVWRLFLRSYRESRAALEYLFPTLLVLAFFLIISRYVLQQALGRKTQLLLLCAFLSWGAMFISPHYPDRATFGTMMLCICVIVSLARKIQAQCTRLAWPLWCCTVLIWLRGMYFCGEYLSVVWGWIK